MLVGHEHQQRAFLQAARAGQMHHAWLLAGPKGVGKRTFADAAALRLLEEGNDGGESGGFDVPPDAPAAQLIAAGSHLDHHIVERLVDAKGRRAGGITVDQIRALLQGLRGTAVLGRWRTVIIDAIDDLNRSAANALLKALEEPAADTVFFLVSHAPGRLLPTIRSRCRMLRFQTLADDEMRRVLAVADVAPARMAPLLALADGAPGAVLGFPGVDMAALAREVDAIWRGASPLPFARSFGALAAEEKFEALLALAPGRLVRAARGRLDPRLAALHHELAEIAGPAVAFAYDRVQVAFAVAGILGRAGRLAPGAPADREGQDQRT